jgi:hypothetical protein
MRPATLVAGLEALAAASNGSSRYGSENTVHQIAAQPPGRSAALTFRRATGWSSQWNEVAATTASNPPPTSAFSKGARSTHLRHGLAETLSEPRVRLNRDHGRSRSDKMPGHQPRPWPDLQHPAARSKTTPRPQHRVDPWRIIRPPFLVTSGIGTVGTASHLAQRVEARPVLIATPCGVASRLHSADRSDAAAKASPTALGPPARHSLVLRRQDRHLHTLACRLVRHILTA